MISDWESLPGGLRRSAGTDAVCVLQKVCCVHLFLRQKFFASLPEEVAKREWPPIHDGFKLGVHDACFKELAETQPVPWDVTTSLPEIHYIYSKVGREIDQLSLAKRNELQKQVDNATFEQLKNDLMSDLKNLQVWDAKKKDVRLSWESRVATHKRIRRSKGQVSIKYLMDNRLRLANIDSLSEAGTDYAEFKHMMNKDVAVATGDTLTLVNLDFSRSPPMNDVEVCIRVAAQICHQSPLNVCALWYPVRYKGQSVATHLAICRKLEDRLLHHCLSIDTEISIHFKRTDHDADARMQHSRGRLCVSSKVGDDSVWLKADWISLDGGKMEGVPMIRVRDMRSAVARPVGPVNDFVCGPAERMSQRGPDSTKAILMNMVPGMSLSQKNKIIVMDLNPLTGDWLDGVWALQCLWGAGEEIPFFGYFGVTKKSDSDYFNHLLGQTQGMLFRTWWENHPNAGAAEPSIGETDLVTKPDLALCSWNGDDPIIPDIVIARFPEASDCFESWKNVCAAAAAEIARVRVAQVTNSVARANHNAASPQLAGPDLSFGVVPVSFDQRMMTMEVTSDADFNQA
jgi:hypothetical protein